MKRLSIALMAILVILSGVMEVSSDTRRKTYIHPTFAALLRIYPRNKPILNPQVPRISPQLAYNLYLQNKAVFFSTGNLAHGHNIPGTYPLPEGKEMQDSIIRKVKRIKNKYIILYCD